MSEHSGPPNRFLRENPYAGLIEVMDKTGETAEVILVGIRYAQLDPSLREAVYDDDMELSQIMYLTLLEPEAQVQFWKNYHALDMDEFKAKIMELRRYLKAVKFAEDFGSGPDAIKQMIEIGEEEATRIFTRFMEVYPNLRSLLAEKPDADL